MAKRSYYSHLIINTTLTLGEGVECHPRALLVSLLHAETLIRDEQCRPRWATLNLCSDIRFLHSDRFALLAPHLPSLKITVNWETVTRDDLLPAYPQIHELDIMVSANDASFMVLPPALRDLEMHVDGETLGNGNEGTFLFPESLRSLAISGEYVPLYQWGVLPSQLHTLVLECMDTVSVQTFNQLHLPALKRLEICLVDPLVRIDDGFQLPLGLEALEISGDRLESFVRVELPASLKWFKVKGARLAEFAVEAYPATLEEIGFCFPLQPQGWAALRSAVGLKTFRADYCKLCTLDILEALPPSLEVLLLPGNRIGWSERLSERETNREEQGQGSTPPSEALAELPGDLHGRSLVEHPESLLWFPQSLHTLDLSWNRELASRYPPLQLRIPPTLAVLNLDKTGITSLEGMAVPALLHTLKLNNNRLTAMPTLQQEGLVSLHLFGNSISKLEGELPSTLTTLDLRKNQITEVDVALPRLCLQLMLDFNPLKRVVIQNAADPGLTLTQMQLLGVGLASLGEVVLPHTLRSLVVCSAELTNLTGFAFPRLLRSLNLDGCGLEAVEGVVFPEGLQRLDLGCNRLRSLEGARFPLLLTHLDASHNRLTDVRRIDLPLGLESLDLACNGIGKVIGWHPPPSLRQLNMSRQTPRMKRFAVVLPERLQCLVLSKNRLKAEHLRQLVFPPSLKQVHLYNNTIEDYAAFKVMAGGGERVEWDTRYLWD